MKFRIFGKKQVLTFVIIALWLAAILTVIILTAATTAGGKDRKLPVYSVAREDKKIALTFNAAWGDETTDKVLKILGENDVKATFFFVGTFAGRYPESVVKIHNAGHEIGNHSLTHKDPVKLDESAVAAEISECSDLLFSITGVRPVLYRAPSGSYDNKTLEAAGRLGLTAIQWSADSIDWKDPSPETITERILKKTAPGGILLFHLGKENTAEALPEIIKLLKAEGYAFVTVSALLLAGETYIDANGVQRQKN